MKKRVAFYGLTIFLAASSFSIHAMFNVTRQRALQSFSMLPLVKVTPQQPVRTVPVSSIRVAPVSSVRTASVVKSIQSSGPMQQRRFYSSYESKYNKNEDMLSLWGWRSRWFPWSPEYRARVAYDGIVVDLNRGVFPTKNQIILFSKNLSRANIRFLMELPLKDGHSVIFKFLTLIANQNWQQLIEDKSMDRVEIISSPHLLYGATLNDKDRQELQIMCKRLISVINNNFVDTTPIKELERGVSVLLGFSVYVVGFTKDAVDTIVDFIIRSRHIDTDTIIECKKQVEELKKKLGAMGYEDIFIEAEIIFREEFLKSAQAVKDALNNMFAYEKTTYARQDYSRNSYDEYINFDRLTLEELRNMLIARLNLEKNALDADIARKFRQESMKIHPDIIKGSGDEFSELSRLYNAFNDKRLGRSEASLK